MDTIREYWEEDRGMVIGGAVVAAAVLVFLFAMVSALLGGPVEPAPIERSHSAGPALPSAGSASAKQVAGVARVAAAMGQTIVDNASSSDVPDITPETMESLLEHTSSEAASETASDANATANAGDAATSDADSLTTKIASLPEPATTDAIM